VRSRDRALRLPVIRLRPLLPSPLSPGHDDRIPQVPQRQVLAISARLSFT
jgi:hypothetical protein